MIIRIFAVTRSVYPTFLSIFRVLRNISSKQSQKIREPTSFNSTHTVYIFCVTYKINTEILCGTNRKISYLINKVNQILSFENHIHISYKG